MYCWGKAVDGQLGLGGIEDTSILSPRFNKHVGRSKVVEIGCGLKHTLLLMKGGKVLSCGSNEKGQLGQDQSVTRPGPISTLETMFISQVACGSSHSLVLEKSGQVYAWGDGQYGQLGLGLATAEPRFAPRLVKSLKDHVVVQIHCGANHCLALTQKGDVFTWGLNTNRQLGIGSEQVSVPTPMVVPSLCGMPVVKLAAGRGHSLVVTQGGVAFSWGRNNFGQLGIGSTKDETTPTQISMLSDEVIRHVACGEEHTVLLTETGKVYTCGSSSYGQLGHGSNKNLDVPTLVQTLAEKEVWQVMCGRAHTVMVLGPTGDIYCCGCNSNGQLGTGKGGNLLEPTLIVVDTTDLGSLPELGTSVDPEDEGAGPQCWLKRVFSGGDQNFAAFVEEKAPPLTEKPSMGTASTTDSTPSSTEATPTLIDTRKLLLSDCPYFLTREFIAATLGLDKKGTYDMPEAVRRLEIIFSSASCLNGSLLMKNQRCTEKRAGVDITESLFLFEKIRERLRPEDAESKERLLYHMMFQQPMNQMPCDTNLENLLTKKVFPSLPLKPCGLEGLRIFYIMPSYMLGHYKERLLCVYMKRFLELDPKRRNVLVDWFFNGPVDYIVMMMTTLRQLLYKPSFRLKDDIKKNFKEETRVDQEFIRTTFRFLRILYTTNMEKNEPISFDKWHYPYLTDMTSLQEDYFDWIENKGNEVIVLCEFPFVLDTKAKSQLMHFECVLRMKMAVTHAYTQNVHSLFTGQNIADLSPDSFVLMVDRSNIVDSTVVQLIRSDEANFKKPLKIQFIGEEGEDEGGMAKEFFMLLSQRILNPDFGMFVEDEESHLMWFRDGELFYERLDYYTIIGILCGLAIYNSITVYLPFPLTLYKKLLERPPSFQDFKDMFPLMGQSMQSLIDYEGDDFDEHFGLNFTITRHEFGETKVHDLVENGSSISVTKANREKYIYNYMKYFLIDSIKSQFQAFQSGFMRVCSGRILSLLHPRELMLLVGGMQVQNWEEMKKFTQYRNGYREDHPVIITFWKVFNEFSEDQKKKFLIFLTGTNRIPINGFERMGVMIQRMDGGPGFEKLPVAHTCFNILDLPPYPTKEKMRDKLLQATNLTDGFRII